MKTIHNITEIKKEEKKKRTTDLPADFSLTPNKHHVFQYMECTKKCVAVEKEHRNKVYKLTDKALLMLLNIRLFHL